MLLLILLLLLLLLLLRFRVDERLDDMKSVKSGRRRRATGDSDTSRSGSRRRSKSRSRSKSGRKKAAGRDSSLTNTRKEQEQLLEQLSAGVAVQKELLERVGMLENKVRLSCCSPALLLSSSLPLLLILLLLLLLSTGCAQPRSSVQASRRHPAASPRRAPRGPTSL